MKSPLVEALRQASGKSSTVEETAIEDAGVDAEQVSDVQTESRSPESGDLELMDTVAVSARDSKTTLPADEGGILPIDGGGILPIDGAAESAGGVVAAANEDSDAGFYETSSLQLRDENETATVASDAEASAIKAMPPVSMNRHSQMPRLGLYSPLICLALAFASTGSYLAYQKVGGWYHNSDLRILSSKFGATVEQDAAAGAGTEAVQNPFKLIVGSQSSPRSGKELRAIPEAVTGLQQRSSRSQPKIAPVRGFNDEAFDELNAAYDAFERGDYVVAEAAYRRALEVAPRHPNALQGLAAILWRAGNRREALRNYETLLSVDPGNSAAAVALLAGEGASPDAAGESEIKYLIQRHPDSAHLHFALGTHFAKEMRWADARHAFDQALRLEPGNADFLFNLAVSLEHLGQYADARYRYELALGAANATSALNDEVVVARIEQLALLAKSERVAQ